FQTDLEVFNPDPSRKATLKVYYTPADRTEALLYTLDPPLAARESVTLPDILKNYFGVSSGYGVLEIETSLPIITTSNTYNVSGATPGTYGQYSPGQPSRNALGFNDSVAGDLYATGIPNDANHRTNAAVINTTSSLLEAGVQLVTPLGQVLGTRIVNVPAYSLHQLNDIFGLEFASFSPQTGGPYRLNFFVNKSNNARILAYVTVTDRRTGDPYLIPAQGMFVDNPTVAEPASTASDTAEPKRRVPLQP
ncbi:MAG: hypothetical protein ABIT01_15320, partial [Thermoanaerobaculia bacterium]